MNMRKGHKVPRTLECAGEWLEDFKNGILLNENHGEDDNGEDDPRGELLYGNGPVTPKATSAFAYWGFESALHVNQKEIRERIEKGRKSEQSQSSHKRKKNKAIGNNINIDDCYDELLQKQMQSLKTTMNGQYKEKNNSKATTASTHDDSSEIQKKKKEIIQREDGIIQLCLNGRTFEVPKIRIPIVKLSHEEIIALTGKPIPTRILKPVEEKKKLIFRPPAMMEKKEKLIFRPPAMMEKKEKLIFRPPAMMEKKEKLIFRPPAMMEKKKKIKTPKVNPKPTITHITPPVHPSPTINATPSTFLPKFKIPKVNPKPTITHITPPVHPSPTINATPSTFLPKFKIPKVIPNSVATHNTPDRSRTPSPPIQFLPPTTISLTSTTAISLGRVEELMEVVSEPVRVWPETNISVPETPTQEIIPTSSTPITFSFTDFFGDDFFGDEDEGDKTSMMEELVNNNNDDDDEKQKEKKEETVMTNHVSMDVVAEEEDGDEDDDDDEDVLDLMADIDDDFGLGSLCTPPITKSARSKFNGHNG